MNRSQNHLVCVHRGGKNTEIVIPGLTRNPENQHCAWIPGQARNDESWKNATTDEWLFDFETGP